MLPEEQDVADLLRRVQGMATQSNLAILGFTPQAGGEEAAARGVADRPEARRQLPRPGVVPRAGQQVPAHHQRRRHQDQRARRNQSDGSTITAECTATTFVLLDQKEVAAGGGQSRREAGCGAGGAEEDGVTSPMRTLSLTLIGLTLIATLAHAQAAPPAAPLQHRGSGCRRHRRRPRLKPRRRTTRPQRRRAAGLCLQPGRPARSVRQPAAPGSRFAQPGPKMAGLGGLGISEVSLRGVLTSDGAFVGILQGVDSKNYIVRVGDKLSDGTIRSISNGLDGDPAAGQRSTLARETARSAEAAPTDGRGQVTMYRYSILLGLCLAMAAGVMAPLGAAGART